MNRTHVIDRERADGDVHSLNDLRWEVIYLLGSEKFSRGMDKQQIYLSLISGMAYDAVGSTPELVKALTEALDLLEMRNEPT